MAVDLPERIRHEAEVLVKTVDQEASGPFELIKLKGGANNQVFRVATRDSQYCLKWYFSHPDDPRNRLAHEYQFLEYAHSLGIRNIPEPLVMSSPHRLAIFTYINGRPLASEELSSKHIDHAMQFLRGLNPSGKSKAASHLPIASEASFSWREHVTNIQSRIDRLKDFPCKSDLHRTAMGFIQQQLLPSWSTLKTNLEHRFTQETPELGERCNQMSLIVSPSDFGFHNAICGYGGHLYFIDFEYAGWDSPVKCICDFFHQPQVPIPITYLDRVIGTFETRLPESQSLREIVECFLPVYGVKWCCILLNDFLPVHESRRSFSQSGTPSLDRLEEQLMKARQKLASLEL